MFRENFKKELRKDRDIPLIPWEKFYKIPTEHYLENIPWNLGKN